MTAGFDLIAETLAARGDDIARVEAALRAQEVETPSWAFGNSGTRFAVFAQPGAPRDPFEKLEDAAEVQRLTGIARSVALHIPWDKVDDVDGLQAHARELGLEIGAINPNLFQEPEYKLGSLCNPEAGVRRTDPSSGSRVRLRWVRLGRQGRNVAFPYPLGKPEAKICSRWRVRWWRHTLVPWLFSIPGASVQPLSSWCWASG